MDRKYKLYVHTSPSGKRYYGITKQEPEQRWQKGNGYKHNKYFTNAINKYGWNNFQHEVLFNNLSKEEAELLEQFYIALHNTTDPNKGYNITLGGEGANGLEFTEEHKRKLSESHKGHIATEETKNKISENNVRYWKGKHLLKETKRKMSEAKKGKNNPQKKSVMCITTGRIFFTATEAAEYYNTGNSSIARCCKGEYKSAGKLPDGTKLVWKYLKWNHNKTYRVINKKEVA